MPITEEQSKAQRLLNELAGFTGTEQWHRHWLGRLVYTDGVRHLAIEAEAYWLIDLVASWCPHHAMCGQDFVAWRMRVNPDRTAVATATDGNDVELARQRIPWTDFPLQQLDLYLTNNMLLLPSEY